MTLMRDRIVLILAVLDSASQTADSLHIGGRNPGAPHRVMPRVNILDVVVCSMAPKHQTTRTWQLCNIASSLF